MDINDSVAANSGGLKAIQPATPVQAGADPATTVPDEESRTHERTRGEPAQADPEALQDAVEKLNEFVAVVSNNSLKISIDEDLSRVVLQVVNRDNDEIVRQIPAEEVLGIMKRMRDISEEFFGDAKGLLVENKV